MAQRHLVLPCSIRGLGCQRAEIFAAEGNKGARTHRANALGLVAHARSIQYGVDIDVPAAAILSTFGLQSQVSSRCPSSTGVWLTLLL